MSLFECPLQNHLYLHFVIKSLFLCPPISFHLAVLSYIFFPSSQYLIFSRPWSFCLYSLIPYDPLFPLCPPFFLILLFSSITFVSVRFSLPLYLYFMFVPFHLFVLHCSTFSTFPPISLLYCPCFSILSGANFSFILSFVRFYFSQTFPLFFTLVFKLFLVIFSSFISWLTSCLVILHHTVEESWPWEPSEPKSRYCMKVISVEESNLLHSLLFSLSRIKSCFNVFFSYQYVCAFPGIEVMLYVMLLCVFPDNRRFSLSVCHILGLIWNG